MIIHLSSAPTSRSVISVHSVVLSSPLCALCVSAVRLRDVRSDPGEPPGSTRGVRPRWGLIGVEPDSGRATGSITGRGGSALARRGANPLD